MSSNTPALHVFKKRLRLSTSKTLWFKYLHSAGNLHLSEFVFMHVLDYKEKIRQVSPQSTPHVHASLDTVDTGFSKPCSTVSATALKSDWSTG